MNPGLFHLPKNSITCLHDAILSCFSLSEAKTYQIDATNGGRKTEPTHFQLLTAYDVISIKNVNKINDESSLRAFIWQWARQFVRQ